MLYLPKPRSEESIAAQGDYVIRALQDIDCALIALYAKNCEEAVAILKAAKERLDAEWKTIAGDYLRLVWEAE